MSIKSALLRTTTAAGPAGPAICLALGLVVGPVFSPFPGIGAARAQIATIGNVSPTATAPAAGTFQTDGGITVGTGGGAGTINTNRITVDNATLQIDEVVGPISPGQFDGARLHVGTDLGEGSVEFVNGGALVIHNTGEVGRLEGAGLQIGNVPGINGSPAFAGRVDVTDGTVDIASDDNSSFINVGRDGAGTFNATNSVLTIQANTGTASFTLGGSGGSGAPLAGSQGTATLDNTILTLNSDSTTGGFATLSVGRNAAGPANTLNVLNGSAVTLTNDNAVESTSFDVGRSGTTGIANIDASTVTVGDFISVGRDGGNGTLNLTNSATVSNAAGFGLTRVGRGGGTGEIAIRSGSDFNTKNLHIGRDGGSTGTVTVADVGSTLNVADTVLVGRSGNGTLNLGDGPGSTTGILNAHTVIVGTNNGSTGIVNMSGAGALINLSGLAPSSSTPGAFDGAALVVGSNGSGTVNITNGANITVSPGIATGGGLGGGLQIGGSAVTPTGTGNGTVNVDGAGSVLTVNGAFSQIGRDGTGVLNITNGGSVIGTAQSVAVIGRKATGDGTVNVTGTGSTWAANKIAVGTDVNLGTGAAIAAGGAATLNVANGGSVTANDILVAAQGRLTGGGGTIASDITVGDSVLGGGTIAAGNSPGLMSVAGNLGLLGGSTMEIELAGTVFDSGIPQIDYDRVDVADNLTTAGTTEGTVTIDAGAVFDIDFFGAFTAGLGDTFDVLVADDIDSVSLTSLIFDFTGAALATGLDWDIGIVAFGSGRESLRLSVVESQVAVPAPGMTVLFGLGIAGIAAIRRRRTARRD